MINSINFHCLVFSQLAKKVVTSTEWPRQVFQPPELFESTAKH